MDIHVVLIGFRTTGPSWTTSEYQKEEQAQLSTFFKMQVEKMVLSKLMEFPGVSCALLQVWLSQNIWKFIQLLSVSADMYQ